MVLNWINLADPTAAEIAAGAAVIQTALVAGALIFTWRQLKAARDTREATERPFVVIEVVPGEAHSMMDLVITNHGPVIARDVRFEFTPPISSAIVEEVADLELLKGGIPTLAPGRAITTLFDSLIHRKVEEHPDAWDVVVSYRGEGDRQYSERMRIDAGIYRRMMSITRHTVHDVHKELEKIRKLMAKWGGTFGQGLLVRTEADIQREIDELHAERETLTREDLAGLGVDVAGLPED